MGYFILVIAQTAVFPIVSGIVELAVFGGDPIQVFGKWWVFWGVGTRLLGLTAQAVLAARPGSGLYLWVLERNAGARAFYEARGGTCVESVEVLPPGGDPARLKGKPRGLRYTWPDPASLLIDRS